MSRTLARPILLTIVTALTLSACRTPSPADGPADAANRDASPARPLVDRALAVTESKPAESERLLLKAIAADPYHGPAHNNLGVLYLHQGRLFDAASAFEEARKLMPGHPDPRLNLALTLERAGRSTDALAAYTAALGASPDHLPTIQALARLQVRSRHTDEQTVSLLQTIALRGDPEWQSWARARLAEADQH